MDEITFSKNFINNHKVNKDTKHEFFDVIIKEI